MMKIIEAGALLLKEKILAAFGSGDIQIHRTMGLYSFYAEKGGLLLCYETVSPDLRM